MTHRPIDQIVPGGNTSTATVFDVTQVDSSVLFPIGLRVRCLDDSLGTISEFVYGRGVASVTAGDVMIVSIADEAGILVDDNTGGAEIGAVVGVAMAAVVASSYGWFQVYGRATVNVASGFADNGLIYATTTAGTVDDSAGGGQILGMRSAGAIDANNQAVIDCCYPQIMGTSAGLA